MKKSTENKDRLQDKTKLTLRVNYLSAILVLLFCPICYFLLDTKEVIPFVFLGFGILSLINAYVFKKHKNLILTYHITSILALIGTTIVVLFSGGIASPFIFIFGVIVLAGFIAANTYGKVYLYLTILLVTMIFTHDILEYNYTTNVVPEEFRIIFSFLSIIFTVFIIGDVFGKNLLKTHHKLYESNQELKETVHEKETMLREVHHRVKNNLQTVSSLLSLQSRSIQDEKLTGFIKSSQNRVASMAMVHEMLYLKDDYASKVEYRPYVEELSQYLVRSVKGAENNVKLKIDIPDIKLGIDTAIPLGLLINETITNALKYGIKDDSKGEIHIALKQEDDKDYVLSIGDNGEGFPESLTPSNSKSLGLKLINNLARQLRGTIIRDISKKGTNYIIHFKDIGHQFPNLVNS